MKILISFLGPDGCLQYFTGITGTVARFEINKKAKIYVVIASNILFQFQFSNISVDFSPNKYVNF